MSRWLVTGARGTLGRDVVAVLDASGAEVTALPRTALDVTDLEAVRDAVAGHDVVVNAAAWSDIDTAEAAEAPATAVNSDGPRNLAAACLDTGARLVHVSSGYVFDGTAVEPYPEDAKTAPVSAYGRTKAAAENSVLRILPEAGYVVRTAWLYGWPGRGFVSTVLRLASERDVLDIADDRYGQPTWSRALAERLAELGGRALDGNAPPGVYHGTSAGKTSWYEVAHTVFELSGLDPERVRRASSDRFPHPAARPAYCALGHGRWAAAGLDPMAAWRPMLEEAFRSNPPGIPLP